VSEPGCSREFNLQFNVFAKPIPDMSASQEDGCLPLEVQFYNESTELDSPIFFWDFGDGSTSQDVDPVHVYNTPGLYSVTLKARNGVGCEDIITYQDMVEVFPQPIAGIEADPLAATIDNPKISFFEMIQGNYNEIEWDFGDGNTSTENDPVHYYTAPGLYDVIMYTENFEGCWDRDTLQISITEELKIYIPSAFSPDGDGLNDCFAIRGTTHDVINNFTVVIFNRWGQQIYHSSIGNPDCVWDGTGLEGEIVPTDTYVYRIYGEDYRGGKHNFTGLLTVVL
jgi:gliding motility-associated-like protein